MKQILSPTLDKSITTKSKQVKGLFPKLNEDFNLAKRADNKFKINGKMYQEVDVGGIAGNCLYEALCVANLFCQDTIFGRFQQQRSFVNILVILFNVNLTLGNHG